MLGAQYNIIINMIVWKYDFVIKLLFDNIFVTVGFLTKITSWQSDFVIIKNMILRFMTLWDCNFIWQYHSVTTCFVNT